MGLRSKIAWGGLVVALSSFGIGGGARSVGAAPAESKKSSPVRAKPIPTRDSLLKGFNPHERNLEGKQYTSPLAHGYRAVMTLDPGLNSFVEGVLRRYQVPEAGFVALDPKTGKVLAYVSHAEDAEDKRDLVLDASAPAASVFKVVTGAALLENGVKPETQTCYHGGLSKLTMAELVDNPKLDTACISLSGALGFSVNSVFGKLSLKHLSPGLLERYASAFGFNESLPFDRKTEVSPGKFPEDKVEFARTAAGFWNTHMSPLHGGLIAATVANQGRMMRPQIIERIVDAQGETVTGFEPALHRSVIERRTAERLGRMMRTTVTQGTAHKTFFDAKGLPFLPGIDVAGKTGTLSKERPYRGYTWWIGFAPAEAPKIAVAALIVNSPKWRIKASYLGREAMRYYLIEAPKKQAAQVASR